MKRTLTERFLSIVTALFMLLSLAIPVLAEEGAEANTVPVEVSAVRNGGGTIADEVSEMLPDITEVALGETLTVEHPATQSLITLTDNEYYQWTYQYVRIDLRYVEGGHAAYDFQPDQVPSTVITPAEDGKTIEKVLIRYFWEATDTEGRPALVTNVINSLEREVQQAGNAIEAKPQYGMDIYRVDSTEGLTLTYKADMDMTKLGSTMFGDDSWDVLQAHKSEITDATWVDLHFQFDSQLNVERDIDLTEADLVSDMFTEKYNEGSEKEWWTIKPDTNELILHCRWDSASAAAIENLNPMIELTGVKIALPSDWGEEKTLVIRNHGYVDGEVHAAIKESNGAISENWCAIDGGEKDDEFTLTISDKVSLPGLEKIIVNSSDPKHDSVNAGDTISFQLTSNVPENLLDVITYGSSDEVDPPEIMPNSIGDAGSYTLTFHDCMATEFVDPRNFVVKLQTGDNEPIVLPSDPTNGFYVLSQPGASHPDEENPGANKTCDFEITLDLGALYNADIIKEENLGTTSIIVTYDATLSGDVTAGTFVNEAWVTTNQDWETSHDQVEVDTYQIDIHKYGDGQINTVHLAGAEFQLYQENEDGGVTIIEERLISGDDGHVTADGLEAGTYYLKETQAPEGYVCSDTPLEIVIPNDADADNVVHVEFDNTSIPSTGGSGTLMYTIGGAAIVVLAGVLLFISRKSRKKQDR